jgi:hypothetical protein
VKRRAVRAEEAETVRKFGTVWYSTSPNYWNALLSTGHVDVRQHCDTSLWRVQCYDPETDEMTYGGPAEYASRDEAMEVAIEISKELAK